MIVQDLDLNYIASARGWDVAPMWSIARRVDRKGYPDAELLSVYRDYGVIRKSDRDDNHNVESEDLSTYKYVKVGDLVLNKMKTWQGSLGVSAYDGIVSPAYFTCELSPSVYGPYIHYLLRSMPYIAMYGALSKGIRVGQWDLPYEEFRDIPVLLPPLEEQRRIADYLDGQVLLIDNLIELKEMANEVYVEAFASFKHATVTAEGGGNQVSTGLVWMPKAPKEWRKVSLQSHISWRKGIDSGRLNAEYCGQHEGIYPVYSGQTANDGVFAQINTYDFDFTENCLLMSTVGALAGRTKLIGGKFSLSQNCAILIAQTRDISLEFLNYLWPSIWSVMSSQIPSDMQPSVRFSDLAKQWLVLPSIEEQQRIVEVISKAQKNSEALVSTAQSQIQGLRELKSSLITAAVTGTFDVTTGRSVA